MFEFEAPDWRALHYSLARRRRFAFCPVGYYLFHVPGRDGYINQAGEWHYKLYAAKHRSGFAAWINNFFRGEVKKYFSFSSDFRRGRFDRVVFRDFERAFVRLENREYLSDPKSIQAVIEIESGTLSFNDFYEQMHLQLAGMINNITQADFWDELCRISQSCFNYNNSSFCWQLGGINFVSVPDLVWRSNDILYILDMNSYGYEQEYLRSSELFRVYCWRFLLIDPAKVQVINYAPHSGIYSLAERSEEDFSQVFIQLAGEAAMWRDHLIKQYSCSRSGEWLYAQYDKCVNCRFNGICPAQSGTVEPENDSINFNAI